jgi:ribose-phosphate pyrophosphokinase
VQIKSTGQKRLVLATGRAHPELAAEIASLLDIELVPTTSYDFANGEIFVRFDESVRGVDAFVLQSHSAPINDQLMEQLRPKRLLADESLDLIGGVAGLIGPLLTSSHRVAQELAAVCGERLLTLQLDNGGWPSALASGLNRPSLTGFSHGAAGMGAALALLSHSNGNQQAAEAAMRAIAYERSVFDKKNGNL